MELVVVSTTDLEQLIRKVITDVIRSTSVSNLNEIDGERFNQKQAAKYLGITQSTIIRWKKNGAIPYDQLPGSSKVFYYKSQLKLVIQQNLKYPLFERN